MPFSLPETLFEPDLIFTWALEVSVALGETGNQDGYPGNGPSGVSPAKACGLPSERLPNRHVKVI